MKKFIFIFCSLIIFPSAYATTVATREEIKSLSQKLPGGEYKGSNKNGSCTVEVFDNGGDGSGYDVSIYPVESNSENLNAAYLLVMPKMSVDFSLNGVRVQGANYEQTLSINQLQNGTKDIIVTNIISGAIAFGVCVIGPQ